MQTTDAGAQMKFIIQLKTMTSLMENVLPTLKSQQNLILLTLQMVQSLKRFIEVVL